MFLLLLFVMGLTSCLDCIHLRNVKQTNVANNIDRSVLRAP